MQRKSTKKHQVERGEFRVIKTSRDSGEYLVQENDTGIVGWFMGFVDIFSVVLSLLNISQPFHSLCCGCVPAEIQKP